MLDVRGTRMVLGLVFDCKNWRVLAVAALTRFSAASGSSLSTLRYRSRPLVFPT